MNADPELLDLRRSLLARFAELAFRVRTRLLIEGLARVAALTAALAILSFLLDRWLRLSPITRCGLLVVGCIVIAVKIWRQLIRPAMLRLEPIDLANALNATLASRVAAVLELPLLADASPTLVRHAVLRAHQSLQQTDFAGHLNDRRRRFTLIGLCAIVLASFILLLVRPSTTSLWGRRLFELSSDPWPQKTYLDVAGLAENAITVPRGEPFSLRAFARPGSVVPESVTARYHDSGSSIDAGFTRFASNDFRYQFPPVNADTSVELRGGDDVFGPFIVHPVDRPRLLDLQLITQHPTDPAPILHTFTGDDADLAFLPLTKMTLRWTANTPIAQSIVHSATTQPSASDVKRIDDRHFEMSWIQRTPVRLDLSMRSAGANLMSDPTAIAIGLKTDQPPRPSLSFSGVRSQITPSASIPLIAEARDDYGVARLDLSERMDVIPTQAGAPEERHATTQPLFGPKRPTSELDVRVPYLLAVSPMKLAPGALLSLAAVATDDCYQGPQTARSRQLTFRIVTPEELFRDILTRQQSERVKFRRQSDDAHTRSDALATLSNPEALAAIARQHRAAEREVARIGAALTDTLTEMRLNALGTPEAYDLMEKNILQPMRALDTELMLPQKDALDTLHVNDSAALAAVQSRQDQIVRRMDDLLKQMSQWDNFVDVLNQLNEIIRLQSAVHTDTEKLKKTQDEGVFEK